jgi:4'-phosphopantetheinyl transferase
VLACHYLTQETSDLPIGLDWLSPRERATLAGLRFAARREDWLLGRWTAKRAVAARGPRGGTTIPLALIEIVAAADGAPEVFLAARPTPYRISISHRAGRALCFVTSRDAAIGCDLERIEPHDDALADDFFTDDELALVCGVTGFARDRLVALLWSAKESALKLLREGLRLDTRSVVVGRGGEPEGDGWAPLAVECVELGKVLPGWWRTHGDSVITVVTDAPSAPPCVLAADLARVDRAGSELGERGQGAPSPARALPGGGSR